MLVKVAPPSGEVERRVFSSPSYLSGLSRRSLIKQSFSFLQLDLFSFSQTYIWATRLIGLALSLKKTRRESHPQNMRSQALEKKKKTKDKAATLSTAIT